MSPPFEHDWVTVVLVGPLGGPVDFTSQAMTAAVWPTKNDAVLHHEINLGGDVIVSNGIAGHRDDIGEFSRGEHAEIAAAQ
jgi:hypothetical protein